MTSKPYPPPSQFFRASAEKHDMFVSWNRDDRSFFAAGACHILAYCFYWKHQAEGYDIIYTRPLGNYGVTMYTYTKTVGCLTSMAGRKNKQSLLLCKQTIPNFIQIGI